MGDFSWKPLVKEVGPASGTVSPFIVILLAREEVNLLLRLALLLKSLRSSPIFLPLFWLRGREMTVLGYQATRSRGPF